MNSILTTSSKDGETHMLNRANHRRLRRLLTSLVAIYEAREYPFNQPKVQPPQLLLPADFPKGGLTHAYFLFVLCYWMRGGIESDTAIKSLHSLYLLDPDLFDPFKAQNEDPAKLADLFGHFGLGFSKVPNAMAWVNNAKLLIERWNGDPRNIFADFSKYSEKRKWEVAVERIKNRGRRGQRGGFLGFREKMVSMLIYFLMEQELIKVFDFPIPVDFHVSRMLVIHGVFKLEAGIEYTGRKLDHLLDDMRYTSYRYGKRHGISSLVLSNILWLYSRSMCSANPVFKANFGSGSGRNLEIIVPKIAWTKSAQRTYLRTCGSCQVSDTCEFIVRSAHWYKHGSIEADTNKQEPPQLILLPAHEVASTFSGGDKLERKPEPTDVTGSQVQNERHPGQLHLALK